MSPHQTHIFWFRPESIATFANTNPSFIVAPHKNCNLNGRPSNIRPPVSDRDVAFSNYTVPFTWPIEPIVPLVFFSFPFSSSPQFNQVLFCFCHRPFSPFVLLHFSFSKTRFQLEPQQLSLFPPQLFRLFVVFCRKLTFAFVPTVVVGRWAVHGGAPKLAHFSN